MNLQSLQILTKYIGTIMTLQSLTKYIEIIFNIYKI
jgi:hypothetical protein